MLATVLAIAGTLLGAITSGLLQHSVAGRTQKTARREQTRRDQLEAVTALAVAISDHRRAMWMRGDAKLKGDPQERVQQLRGESHTTRSAVTRPLIALRLHVTDTAVREAAETAVNATFAMRQADGSTNELTQARETALAAHDRFVDSAAHYLNAA